MKTHRKNRHRYYVLKVLELTLRIVLVLISQPTITPNTSRSSFGMQMETALEFAMTV